MKEKKKEETHGNHQPRFRSVPWKLAVLSSTYTHGGSGTGGKGEGEGVNRNRPIKRYTCLQFVLLIYTRWNEPVTFTRQTQRDSMLHRSVSDSLYLSFCERQSWYPSSPLCSCLAIIQPFLTTVGKIGSSNTVLETGNLYLERCRIKYKKKREKIRRWSISEVYVRQLQLKQADHQIMGHFDSMS